MIIDQIKEITSTYNAAFQSLYHTDCLAWWKMTTTGTEESSRQLEATQLAMNEFHSDAGVFEQIQMAMLESAEFPLEDRQLQMMYNSFAENQGDVKISREIVSLETRLESVFGNFRGKINGREISDNDLRDILQNSNIEEERRCAWEASKQIGAESAPLLKELVSKRNELARGLGFDNFYVMRLELNEFNQEELFTLLKKVEQNSDAAAQAEKEEIDLELSKRFVIDVDKLEPWHYADPFFQEAPEPAGLNLDQLYANCNLVEIASDFFETLGLDINPILGKSDLLERPGKCQHAFCIDVDLNGDVRILCNLRASERWMSTLLHELGHAAYDFYTDYEMPYILRGPSHTFTTEAVAMLLGRLARNPQWMSRFAGIEQSAIDQVQDLIKISQRRQMRLFTRWVLVMANFERGLYENPDRDLGSFWWDLVEQYQGLKRPAGRDTSNDWACKIHIATAPVYYHCYLLGEMFASQMQRRINESISEAGLCAGPEAGGWLADNIFQPANSISWDELVLNSTGEPLSAAAFGKQFLTIPKN
jgi:peptidyl-dipeptidase A